ncbi:MAG: hypothetical protein OHK0046_32510 [Anaerolineae bacterium]
MPKQLLLFCVLLLAAACTNLSGEPEIVATIPPASPTPSLANAVPEQRPDLAVGAQIYAANCTRCHGENGEGNGELVLSGEVGAMPSFLDAEAMPQKDPQYYFEIITNGNLAQLMPPWGDTLTEAERWSVAYYTYTLRYTDEQLALGQEIYARECVECHGEDGRGTDAIDSTRTAGDFSSPAAMTLLTDFNIYTIIAEGAGSQMEAYADTLTEDELWAVTAYTRSLSLDNATRETQVAQAATPEATAEAAAPETATEEVTGATAIVTGTIINGTSEAAVPDDLVVTLHIVAPDLSETTRETTLDESNSYIFNDVPVDAESIYFVSTAYLDRSFAGNPFALTPEQAVFDQPIFIYEVTDDPSVISIRQVVTQIRPVGEVLEFTQEVLFENTSDRMFLVESEDGSGTSVTLNLPVGAIVAQLANPDRFRVNDENYTVTDTRAVLPGASHIVSLVYLLPYEQAAVIDYPVNYPLNGPVALLLQSETVTLQSEQFEAIPPEQFPNIDAAAYGGNLSLNPGEFIRYELLGRAEGVGTSTDPNVITADNLLPVLLIAVGVILIVAAVLVLFTNRDRRPKVSDAAELDALMRQLNELEAQNARGEINHDLYHQRRMELQKQIAERTPGRPS